MGCIVRWHATTSKTPSFINSILAHFAFLMLFIPQYRTVQAAFRCGWFDAVAAFYLGMGLDALIAGNCRSFMRSMSAINQITGQSLSHAKRRHLLIGSRSMGMAELLNSNAE